MKEYKIGEKMIAVLGHLFRRKNEGYLNEYDMLNDSDGNISSSELDTILVSLYNKGLVLQTYIPVGEGPEVLHYKLSYEGLTLIEDVIAKKEYIFPKPIGTKTDSFKTLLVKYGFNNLPMVKQLTDENKTKLVELICSNKLPYGIAMFDFLGFLEHLEKEHFNIKYKLNMEISKWYNSDIEGRAVKANISTLYKSSTEDKTRYTAHLHKEIVKKDYEKLK